jgi:ribonuclease HI
MAERKRVWKHSDPKKETKKKKRRKIEEAKIPMEKGEIYSDGNCLRNGYPDAKAGTGVAAILSDGTLFALGLKLPGVKQTNNRAELLGLLLSMCMADDQGKTKRNVMC